MTENNRAHHVFEHASFTYVLDFEKMLCWVIDPEEPGITALNLDRKFPSRWYYKPCSIPAPYEEDYDTDWIDKVELRYHDYVNQLVVSRKKTVRAR